MGATASLLQFIIACTIIEATPGPNMAYLALLSATQGRRAGFFTVLGIFVGLLLLGLASALGLDALLTRFPLLYDGLHWAGILYLLWLAWDTWHSPTGTSAAHALQPYRYFHRGLVTNLLNPKAAAFYVTVLPQFVMRSGDASIHRTALFSLIYLVIATAAHSIIVLAASHFSAWMRHPQRVQIVQRLFALLLVGVAVWLYLRAA